MIGYKKRVVARQKQAVCVSCWGLLTHASVTKNFLEWQFLSSKDGLSRLENEDVRTQMQGQRKTAFQ